MRKNLAFVAYAELYRKKYATHQLIEKINTEIAELKKELLAEQEKQTHAEQAVKDTQKKIHTTELELKELDEQDASKKKRILSTKNAKEYESCMKEIDLIAQKRPQCEEAIFSLWEKLELDKKDLEKITNQTADVILQINDEIAQKQQEISQQNTTIDEIEVISQEKGKLVGPEMREKFLKMLEIVPNPAVPVEQGSCTGCFSSVPRAELNKIEQGEILACSGCYRLLYFVRAAS